MADRPRLPPLNAAARDTLDRHASGEIPDAVALMRLILAGTPVADLPSLLHAAPRLAALAARHAEGLALLERMVRAGADHAAPTSLDAQRALFDRLAAISPEASVAAYSLGDPALLAAATEELVAWLRRHGLLAGRPRVLDLGCGTGRLAAAVAPEASETLGFDLSPMMIAEAQRRHGAIPRLRFATTGGGDLAGIRDAGFDLVLAVDVFPYLVQAGGTLAEDMLTEIARVLRPGGRLALLNFAYGEDGTADPCDLAARCGLSIEAAPERPFRLWDATAFRLRRVGVAGGLAL
ncbi:methyltransferase type 11 [Falsiroseomonas bella]|uniref:Methyltransferase type 11 n=1 Tax=Falsiroseomonas bella TaxID=2184016 RepID=A0A317FF60_9PROT|nr:class I SAM-dependent methyltransferase [Falsiroseomonas bella]PWS37012.1 methyltransferase type 11 [Falsiroseomonas bella]